MIQKGVKTCIKVHIIVRGSGVSLRSAGQEAAPPCKPKITPPITPAPPGPPPLVIGSPIHHQEIHSNHWGPLSVFVFTGLRPLTTNNTETCT